MSRAITVGNPDPSINGDKTHPIQMTNFSRYYWLGFLGQNIYIYTYLVKYVVTITCFDKCILHSTAIFCQRLARREYHHTQHMNIFLWMYLNEWKVVCFDSYIYEGCSSVLYSDSDNGTKYVTRHKLIRFGSTATTPCGVTIYRPQWVILPQPRSACMMSCRKHVVKWTDPRAEGQH